MIWSHPAFRLFANSVVAVSTWGESYPNAMSAEWCTPASIEPVLLAVLIGDTRWTRDLVGAHGEFGISLLAADQAGVAHHLGQSSGRDHNKLDHQAGVSWFKGPALGLPLIAGAAAHFECRQTAGHQVGDHVLTIASVVWAETTAHREPLVYHRGKYHRLSPPLSRPTL